MVSLYYALPKEKESNCDRFNLSVQVFEGTWFYFFSISLRTFSCIWRFPHSLLYLFFPFDLAVFVTWCLKKWMKSRVSISWQSKFCEYIREEAFMLTRYQNVCHHLSLAAPAARQPLSHRRSNKQRHTNTHKDREHKNAKTVAPSTRCDNCGVKSSGRHDELLTCVVVRPPHHHVPAPSLPCPTPYRSATRVRNVTRPCQSWISAC